MKSKSSIELIERLGDRVIVEKPMIEVKEPQFEPIIQEKAFGLISNNLIEKMAETNPTA